MPDQPDQPQPNQHMRITSVYTKFGDAGSTQLVGGRVVPKSDQRLNAYGTSDELQIAIAAARDQLSALTANLGAAAPPLPCQLELHLIWLQNRLFTLNGELATRQEDRWPEMPLVGLDDVRYMEELIDALNAPMPPLKDFVIAGGHPAVTALHQCRVVCRRAERETQTLAQLEPIPDAAIPFLNRLSDLFFVMARRTHFELHRAGLAPAESTWVHDLPKPPLPMRG